MKTVKLSEESYNKLKKSLVNEISYGVVDRAYNRSDDLFWGVYTSFEDFYESLNEAIFNAKNDSREGEQTSNPYLEKIKGCADIIRDILTKKKNQQDKFIDNTTSKIDHRKFYDSPDAEENDIDDMDLNYLQKKFPK
jgi:hypothetical protein